MENKREKYISGNIFQIGDLVEDIESGELLQILDRGSNYVTVQEANGNIAKRWIDCVRPTEEKPEAPYVKDGQLVFNSHVSEYLGEEISTQFCEQYSETSDLFAWRHATFNVEYALNETNLNKRYEFLERAEKFFENMNVDIPLYLICEKSSVEQMRIAEMIAAVAEVDISGNPSEIVKKSISKMKESNLSKKEWMITHKLFKAAKAAGINFPLSLVPHIGITESVDEKIWDLLDDNLDELVDSIDEDDLLDAFDDEEEIEEEFLSDKELNEVLSISGRKKLGIQAKVRNKQLTARRVKKLKVGASTEVLQRRARKLANTMLKRRIFRKAPANMTRGEKERFEKQASKRKSLIDRLAKRLLNRVRMMQKDRMKAKS